ncbi:Cytochrome p450 [Thalictrum thalictroides]|uniref:Cytochrome p450 n=2 Tax=Thalictrum thalictroides TaxID=46969 RepID=A0A7J6X963_THATH|nr:Cytochrome p450 [Thalictrum thalictroides]
MIGQSFGLLRAMKANTAEKWIEDRVNKYGPVSKLTLFGKPTVIIHGQAANKFAFTSDTLSNQQPQSIQTLLGERNLMALSGEDHKRVRGALVAFLKPEVLKQYVGKMDGEMRKHLESYWEGKQKLTVLPVMKSLTYNIICSLLFGMEPGTRREKFLLSFQYMIEGMWSVPVNLPFTRYNRSIRASSTIQTMVRDIIGEKRLALDKGHASPDQDLITSLLSIHGEGKEAMLSESEIVDNVMLVMTAGYDTSSVLITFMVRLMATDPIVYAAVLREQEEIAKCKKLEDLITWEDLNKMKYTWRVALEILRISPPVFGGFRKTLKDIEFGGYLIPKGWQVFWAANMTHMNESIFPEPSKFDPKRFENQSAIPPYCFVAFGGGPRICPGYEFARIEILVAMHYLVTRFTWKLCGKDNKFSRDPMPVPTEGLPIQIKAKKILRNHLMLGRPVPSPAV